MTGFTGMSIWLHVPVRRAIRSGFASHGTVEFHLQDSDVQTVPDDLRDALAEYVEAAYGYSGDQFEKPPCLELDTPDESMGAVIRALRREKDEERRQLADTWMSMPDEKWVDWSGVEPRVEAEVRTLASLPDVAERLQLIERQVEAEAKESGALAEAAREGIRSYALRIPKFHRGAAEGYDVVDAAIDHYAARVASLDEDAFIYRASSEAFKQSQLRERKAPDEHAFEVLDRIAVGLTTLERPAGIAVDIERIQRFRQATKDGRKWVLSFPITVVVVRIRAHITPDRMVLFFADAEEKQRYQREQADDDIPF